MTIDPLVALVIGVIMVNVTVVWLLVRGGDGVREILLADVERRPDGRDGTDESTADRVLAPSDPSEPSEPFGSANRAGSTDADRNRSTDTDRTRSGPLPIGDPPPLSTDGDVVVCQHCGAENRPGYRYCRWCVRSGFVGAGSQSDADANTTGRPF